MFDSQKIDALVRACLGQNKNPLLPDLARYTTADLQYAANLIRTAGDPLRVSTILVDEMAMRERIARQQVRLTLHRHVRTPAFLAAA